MKKDTLILLALLLAIKTFSQLGPLNTDSIQQPLNSGERKLVVETFIGDSVTSRHIIEQDTDPENVEGKYIIRFESAPLLKKSLKSKSTFQEIEREHEQFRKDFKKLLNKNGIKQKKTSYNPAIYHEFKTLINGVAVIMTKNMAREVENLTYVTKVEKDIPVRACDNESNQAINVPQVWSELGYTGEGVVIAIIDTGVDTTHICFSGSKFEKGYDFVNNDDDPYDDHHHGTHCASIAAANSDEIKGVAPDARIMPVKVLGSNGDGISSDAIAGIEFAVDPDNNTETNDGAQILSLSLEGEGHPDDAMSTAIDNAVENGAICVVSAGNSGNSKYTINSPGCARKALTVGSCNNNGITSSFSSRGPTPVTQAIKPEISAPGENIYAAIPGNKYENLSGTSMATPHVAGLAALVKQKNGNFDAEQIMSTIIQSAQRVSGEVLNEGYGMIDAYKALQNNLIFSPYVMNLGVISPDQDITNITEDIQITNTSGSVQNISISEETKKEGLDISISPQNFVLSPNETKTISISCSINPSRINIQDQIPVFSHNIVVNDNKNAYNFPFVGFIGKTIQIIFSDTPAYCAIFNSYWTSSFTMPPSLLKQSLILGDKESDLFVAFDKFNRYVLNENIEKEETEIQISPYLASNKISVKAYNPNGSGSILKLLDGPKEIFRKKGYEYSGLRLTRFSIIVDTNYGIPDVEKYFSNISDEYVYENSLFAYPFFNDDLKQIVNIPVGLNQGINESKEIYIGSNEYRKLKLNLNPDRNYDNLYYTTDYRYTGYLYSNPFEESVHRINPQSVFEFYMLPEPYEDFSPANGTRFSFWTKFPEEFPFDIPVLTTSYYYLDSTNTFSFAHYSNAKETIIEETEQILSKNMLSFKNLLIGDEIEISDPLWLIGKNEEIYRDTLFLRIKSKNNEVSIDTLSAGYSYNDLLYSGENITRNVDPADSVFLLSSYQFDNSTIAKTNFSCIRDVDYMVSTDFPQQVELKGNVSQNKYFLPGENNKISCYTIRPPKIWIKKRESTEWNEISYESQWDTTLGQYNLVSTPINGYEKGYYDLKITAGNRNASPAQTTAQWSPAFYICDETQADSLCLVELYKATNGINWNNNSGWLKENLSKWYGITLGNSRVTNINLPGNNLSGSIPEGIIHLTKLSGFDISNNKLESIPDLSESENLTELDASKNKLDFSSIVPNNTIASFIFSSQDSLLADCEKNAVINETLTFNIKNTYKDNYYIWIKDDQVINESDTSRYSIIVDDLDNTGTYYCRVYNKNIPDFFIPTKKVQITVVDRIFEATDDQSIIKQNISFTNWVDVDNDGDEDLFAGNEKSGSSSLYVNQMKETGSPIFEEDKTGSLYHLPLSVDASFWADFNNDGLEDMATFNANDSIIVNLFENSGNRNFTQKTLNVNADNTLRQEYRGACWVDLDYDNYLDLCLGYVEWNDNSGISRGVQLFNNQGELKSTSEECDLLCNNILFSDLSAKEGTEIIITSNSYIGIYDANNNCYNKYGEDSLFWEWSGTNTTPSLGDFDNDGDMDIFIPTNTGNANYNVFLENTTDGFQPVADYAFSSEPKYYAKGSACFDFDNDGDLDLAVANGGGINELYKNLLIETGKLSFAPVTSNAFEGKVDYWTGISASDINLDGYLDILETTQSDVRFLLNKNSGKNWLSVKCKGKISNGSALQTKVYAVATINEKKTKQYREILAVSGQTSLMSKRLHFGLGDATEVDSLIIHWPSGITNIFTEVDVNQFMEITECPEPTPVTDLKAIYSEGIITLTWKNETIDEDLFVIEFIKNDNDLTYADTISGTETSWEMPANYEDKYYFRIRSVSDCGSQALSDFVQSEIKIGVDIIKKPTLIYPNPANNYLYINSNEIGENSVVNIYDMHGKRVLTITTIANIGDSILSIDVSHLNTGLYAIEIISNKKIFNQIILIRQD